MAKHIYGMHDPGDWFTMLAQAGVTGWCLYTEAIGCDPNDRSGKAFGVPGLVTPIARLNNGYAPAGTIPLPNRYADFAQRCANFVQASTGCERWVVGNEIAIGWEHPEGRPISLDEYVECFRLCREAIRRVQPNAQVIPQPPAPWNNSLQYPGNERGDWAQQLADMLTRIGAGNLDGIALHTYTHGHIASLVHSDATMNPPFQDRHYHFYAYRDFMNAIPAAFRGLPVYITETNPDGWENKNDGWLVTAYEEIDRWNQSGRQIIHCLCPYRWWTEDREQFHISPKTGVVDDFRQALARRYAIHEQRQPGGELITLVEVNFRAKPGMGGAILDRLPRNAVLRFWGDQEMADGLPWARVEWNGKTGWVAVALADERPLVDTFDDSDWGWCWRFVIAQEGGLANDPNDAGGLTKFGIAQAFHPEINVAALTLEGAKQIYFADYWTASGASALPWPLCLHHFDFAVNAGVGMAGAALRSSNADLREYIEYRRVFYETCRGTDYQRTAWLRRLNSCIEEGGTRTQQRVYLPIVQAMPGKKRRRKKK